MAEFKEGVVKSGFSRFQLYLKQKVPAILDFAKLGCGQNAKAWTIRVVGTPKKGSGKNQFSLDLVENAKGTKGKGKENCYLSLSLSQSPNSKPKPKFIPKSKPRYNSKTNNS